MNTKKNQEINKKNDIKLSNQFEKSVNLSNSEESYEEYTPKEIEYIDKYKAMALNRLTDDEVYDIVCKYNFNDEKIEREIKEFTKLILNKGDDYSWTIIDTGKKKKLFINESESKKKDERTDRYNKRYNAGGNNTYYSNRGGYYNSNRSNYKNRTFKKYQQEAYAPEEANAEGAENLNADAQKDETQNDNYYQGNYYGNRGYTRGRGRQRGRGRGRGNYSYNYRFKEDYVIEKELNPSIQENILNLKPENLEVSEKPATAAEQVVEVEHGQKEPSAQVSPKKHLNIEATEAAQKADLHKSPIAINKNVSNSDSEYAIENFLSSNENNTNKLIQESPQKQTAANANISSKQANQENANINAHPHTHTEKSTIFINNAIPNTNQSKLTNLFETNKERESPSKKATNESDLNKIQQEKLKTTAPTQHSISTASNFEFNSKINQPQTQQTNINVHKNLIQESSTNITFNKTARGKFEDNAISVENNSFGVFSAPKKETVVSSHQAHNFTFSAQAPTHQQNKFNPVGSSAANKNQMMPTNPVNANQNLNQGQIPNLGNLSNLNKPSSQQNKNETGNNPLNMNMSPNMQFNPMMPTGSMQPELSAGFPFAGANPLQQGFYPMLWYYPPAQGGNLEQYQGVAGATAGANAQMPFMPYPMAYYVNPYMFGQQETTKDAENANNINAKARKNNAYGNVSAYHGMNPNESNNQQTAGTQGIPNAYTSPYMYFNSQFPSSGMNQMMGVNSTPNAAAWNNPYMNPIGMNMPGQMNLPSYENPNYNNMKSSDQSNPNNLFQYKFLNQN